MTLQSGSDALARAIAALGSADFGAALQNWLAWSCAFDNFAIVAFPHEGSPVVLRAHAQNNRVFERINSHYVAGAYLLDPVYALHTEAASEGLYRLLDIAPDQFTRNEYHRSRQWHNQHDWPAAV